MKNNHLEDSVCGVHPCSHDCLKQWLGDLLSFLLRQSDVKNAEHFVYGLVVSRHDCLAQSVDWRHDELGEGSLKRLLIGVVGFVSPNLLRGVKVVVAPEFLHHFFFLYSELLRVSLGEELKRESPTVFS